MPLRRGTRAADEERDPVSSVLRWTAWLGLGALVLLWILVLDADAPAGDSFLNFVEEALPNIAAVLGAYLVVSYLLEREGISPQQVLRRAIVSDVRAEVLDTPEVAGIYERIPDTPYDDMFRAAVKVEMVGRWFNETLTRHPDELRAFLNASTANELVLVVNDWTKPEIVDAAARQYSGYSEVTDDDRNEVTYKARMTAEVLRRACQQVGGGANKQVSTFIYPGAMNYWGLRFRCKDGRDLLFMAPYDNFRTQALACPTVVFDLTQSEHVREFWERELATFIDSSTVFSEWQFEQAQAQIDRAIAVREKSVPPVQPGEWAEIKRALEENGFRCLGDVAENNRPSRRRFTAEEWVHPTGRVVVQIEDGLKVVGVDWDPLEDAGASLADVGLPALPRSTE